MMCEREKEREELLAVEVHEQIKSFTELHSIINSQVVATASPYGHR
jgi:hypothetical protein